MWMLQRNGRFTAIHLAIGLTGPFLHKYKAGAQGQKQPQFPRIRIICSQHTRTDCTFGLTPCPEGLILYLQLISRAANTKDLAFS